MRVEMEYDAQYRIPEDAKAVIVTPPTLVADRFVQLTPVFEDGDAVLADGADIALPETAVPVELDRIYSSLQSLTQPSAPPTASTRTARSTTCSRRGRRPSTARAPAATR